MVFNFLLYLYKIRISKLRRLIEKIIIKFESVDGNRGEFWSITLRKIYKKYYGIEIGNGSYGCFDSARFPKGIVIGNYCSIAAEVRYFNANHPTDKFTTHPMIYNTTVVQSNTESAIHTLQRNTLTIGHDVWLGYGVLIMPYALEIHAK